MEKIIQKAIEGGYVFNKSEIHVSISTRNVCDPLFWQALGKATGEKEWEIRHTFFDIVFDDDSDGGNWDKAVEWLTKLIEE